MTERKVLNKYYPPDFDPSKVPRRKLGGNKQQTVRLMAPFSMRCNTCGEYMYKGKKFNARKETAEGEEYYGIKVFRFYIKCTQCSSEITFKTDPRNTDYVAEHGVSRNFEPWREDESSEQKDRLDELEEIEEEENNPMKALENKTEDSKREMDILDKLQEIRTRNSRMERVDSDKVLKTVSSRADNNNDDNNDSNNLQDKKLSLEEQKLIEEEEALIRKHFGKIPQKPSTSASTSTRIAPSENEGNDQGNGTAEKTEHGQEQEQDTITFKRKIVDTEPDALSLATNGDSKKLAKVDWSSLSKKPKAKDKSALAAKLGIKKKT